jgi:hypothetical protein
VSALTQELDQIVDEFTAFGTATATGQGAEARQAIARRQQLFTATDLPIFAIDGCPVGSFLGRTARRWNILLRVIPAAGSARPSYVAGRHRPATGDATRLLRRG